MSAPEANAYELQSQGVVDMLEKLAGKFDDERKTLEEEETEAVHSYEMLSADLKNQLDAARSAEAEKSQAKAKALQGATKCCLLTSKTSLMLLAVQRQKSPRQRQ